MSNDVVSSPAAADTHVAPAGGGLVPAARKLPRFHFIPRLIGYARITYLVGLVLGLVIVSPVDWIPTPLLKITVFTIALVVTMVLFALGGGVRELMRAPGRAWAWAAALALPAAYLLSWWYSADRSVALTGVGNEVDTILFAVVAALSFLLGFALLRTLRSIRQLIGAIGVAVVVAALFQYASILIGVHVLPAMFADKSVNLAGKWNDFGMLVSLGALLLLARLELGDDEGWRRYAAIAALVLLGVLIVLVQFNFIWWFTVAGALIIGLLKWLPAVRSADAGALPVAPSRLPWIAGAAVVVCAVFLVAGVSISAHLPGFLQVPSLEVRPSFATTYDIAAAAHQGFGRFVLGSGPNTFTNDWILNRPVSVNLTPFWNIDFITGYSILATAFATVGLFGAIAWLIPLALVAASLWQLRGIRRMPTEERLTLLSIGLVSAFLWVGVVFYAGSQDMALLAFATAGALWATEAAARRPGLAPSSAPAKRRFAAASGALAVVLVVISGWPAAVSARQFLSYSYAQRGAKALAAKDYQSAAQYADASQRYAPTSDNLRLGMALDLAVMQQLATASTTPASIDGMRAQFQAALSAAIAQGKRASEIHPHDYQAYAQIGQVYEFLVSLKVPGAFESAQAAYRKAIELNPTNPTLPLLLARVEATEDLSGNLADIQKLVSQSLALKSNYTDAFLFIEQLAVAQNDLPTATKAAEAVVASSPQDPAQWFQLGLYFYAGQDWADAVKAFQNAVSLEGDYANAKYFLGLSEYKTGNTDDAVKQFSDLVAGNPDNAEVKLILANLQGGKDPFAGENPPQPSPEQRASAPIKETASPNQTQ